MVVEGTRTSALPPVDGDDLGDLDRLVALDREDTGQGPGGTLGGLSRLDAIKALLNRRPLPPVQVSEPFGQALNTAWGFNTNALSVNRHFVEESTPGTVREWAVYIRDNRHPMLARRGLASKGGTVPSVSAEIDLTTKLPSGTTPGSVDRDAHCGMQIHIDSDGYEHVFANFHNDPITGRYCVSRVPYSLTLGDYVEAQFESGATNVDAITYPQLVPCSDGTFVMVYRNGAGGSGNGDTFVKRYTPDGSAPPASGANSRWGAAVKIVDGVNDGPRSFYPWQIATDPNDRSKHWIFGHWNVDSDDSVERFASFYTDDDFATFKKPDGTALTLPIDTSDYTGSMVVHDVASQNQTNFPSQGAACVDSQGRPHGVYRATDGGVNRIRVAYWNGTAWTTAALGLQTSFAPRCSIFASRLGGVYVLYMEDYNRRGKLSIVDVTPGTSWWGAEGEVLNLGFHAEISTSQQPILDFGLVKFVHAQQGGYADGDASSPEAAWYTNGYSVTIDADRAHDVIAGRHTPPRGVPVPISSVQVPDGGGEFTVVVQDAETQDLGLQRVPIPSSVLTGEVLVKLTFVARVDASTTMTVQLAQIYPPGGSIVKVGETRITTTTDGAFETAWFPVRAAKFLGSTEIAVFASITSGTGKGYFRSGVIHPQVVDYTLRGL